MAEYPDTRTSGDQPSLFSAPLVERSFDLEHDTVLARGLSSLFKNHIAGASDVGEVFEGPDNDDIEWGFPFTYQGRRYVLGIRELKGDL